MLIRSKAFGKLLLRWTCLGVSLSGIPAGILGHCRSFSTACQCCCFCLSWPAVHRWGSFLLVLLLDSLRSKSLNQQLNGLQ